MEEQELSRRCAAGDNAARELLYEQFSGRLFSICLRYMGDPPAAEDLLHDVFLKIFDSFGKFTWRGNGSLRAWMERVTVNAALEYLRKNPPAGRPVPLDGRTEPAGEMLLQEEPGGDEVDALPPEVLMRFIAELPYGYRTVFNLYVFENKSHREIAAVLGINEKSSSSQLLRAKRMLAGKIKAYVKERE